MQWSAEQAKEHSLASAKYHQLQHMVGGGHSHGPTAPATKSAPPPTEADLESARRRWEESDALLRAAQGDGKRTAWWLRAIGATIAGIGVLGLVITKERAVKHEDSRQF